MFLGEVKALFFRCGGGGGVRGDVSIQVCSESEDVLASLRL